MKNSIKLFVTLLLLSFTGIINAQKIAHIDSEKLVTDLPEKAAIEKKLTEESEKHKIALEKMQKELQDLYTKYEGEAAKTSKEVNQTRNTELTEKQKKMGEYQQMAVKEIQKKEEELYKPVLQRVQNTINEVAKEKGFEYVLNANALVYAVGYDLYDDVKAKLNSK